MSAIELDHCKGAWKPWLHFIGILMAYTPPRCYFLQDRGCFLPSVRNSVPLTVAYKSEERDNFLTFIWMFQVWKQNHGNLSLENGQTYFNSHSEQEKHEWCSRKKYLNTQIVYKSEGTADASFKHSLRFVDRVCFNSISVINLAQATIKKTNKRVQSGFYRS